MYLLLPILSLNSIERPSGAVVIHLLAAVFAAAAVLRGTSIVFAVFQVLWAFPGVALFLLGLSSSSSLGFLRS